VAKSNIKQIRAVESFAMLVAFLIAKMSASSGSLIAGYGGLLEHN
jgi:hypothetical protein